jgi:hypothetical protein
MIPSIIYIEAGKVSNKKCGVPNAEGVTGKLSAFWLLVLGITISKIITFTGGKKVFSTSELCVSEIDSASLIAAASSDFFSASSLCFSARWKAGGSAPPSSPPDSSVNWTIRQCVNSY